VSCPSNPLDCIGAAVGGVAGAAADSVLGSFADAIKSAVADLVKATLTWWVGQPSLDVAASPVGRLQALLLPVTVLVAVGGLMWRSDAEVPERRVEALSRDRLHGVADDGRSRLGEGFDADQALLKEAPSPHVSRLPLRLTAPFTTPATKDVRAPGPRRSTSRTCRTPSPTLGSATA